MKRWMQTSQPQFLGELFNQKGGDAQCNRHVTTSEAAPTVQSAGAATDVCRNRSRGNTESALAFQSISDRLTVAQERIYRAIKDRGECGATTDELCVVLGLTPNEVSPRISELHFKLFKIEKVGTRPTRNGHPAAVWKAI